MQRKGKLRHFLKQSATGQEIFARLCGNLSMNRNGWKGHGERAGQLTTVTQDKGEKLTSQDQRKIYINWGLCLVLIIEPEIATESIYCFIAS